MTAIDIREGMSRQLLTVAQHLGIGSTLAWELVRTGRLRSIRVSRRVLVPRVAMEEFIREQLDGRSV